MYKIISSTFGCKNEMKKRNILGSYGKEDGRLSVMTLACDSSC